MKRLGLNLRYSLGSLLFELSAVGGLGEYVIFGSTAIRLRDIIQREPDDIDVMVSRRVWGALLAREGVGWHVETPKAGDPPILSLDDVPNALHLFYDWRDDAVDINPTFLLVTAEHVGGYRLATVEEVLRHKHAAYACIETHPSVAKHAPDIAACEAWLERS